MMTKVCRHHVTNFFTLIKLPLASFLYFLHPS